MPVNNSNRFHRGLFINHLLHLRLSYYQKSRYVPNFKILCSLKYNLSKGFSAGLELRAMSKVSLFQDCLLASVNYKMGTKLNLSKH